MKLTPGQVKQVTEDLISDRDRTEAMASDSATADAADSFDSVATTSLQQAPNGFFFSRVIRSDRGFSLRRVARFVVGEPLHRGPPGASFPFR